MRWVIPLIIYVVGVVYGFQAVKTAVKSTWVNYIYLVVAFLVIANLFYQFNTGPESRVLSGARGYAIGFLLSFLALNLVLTVILFGEDIFRVFKGLYLKFFTSNTTFDIASRRKFLSQIALGLAAIPFSSLLYGMYKGRYNYKVLKYTLHFPDLPDAFDGYKLTHISDIHSGSFDNKEKIGYAVDLVNEQKSDVILFTGDLVNNRASEMYDWKDTFSKLTAKDGVFSVLGNHDYGDYVRWDSAKAKQDNLKELFAIQKEIGFDLLLNENRQIERNGQKINILGVENWGASKHFPKRGSLKKAAENIENDTFNILMSHDPSHFDYTKMEFNERDSENPNLVLDETNIVDFEKKIHLTLAGHTHGMQFGIEIPSLGIKWSPVKWRYKKWAGIYTEKEQYLNVNRGFGYLAYPGRVGIWPEITVIELKKGTQIA